MSNPELFSAYSNRSAVLHKMVQQLPRTAPTCLVLSESRQERNVEAESDADKAIELNKRFTKGYLRRGAAREGQGKLQEALKDFEHARALEPCNKETARQIRRVRKALGMPVSEEVEGEGEEEKEVPLTTFSVVDYNTDSDYDDCAPAPTRASKKHVAEETTVEKAPQPLLQPELHELPVPSTGTQFEHTWTRVLRGNASGRAEYLRAVSAIGLTTLFQEGHEHSQ